MPSSSHASDLDSESPRCSDASVSVSDWPAEPRLRGLRWRVLLGVLPSCPAPIESLRRAAADGRRRYAELRRRLIIDPHTIEDGHRGENLSVNNPLSQDPDSVWRHYFKNTELEKTIENDLTRLYPEDGSFFQGSPCQSMLKRILLVWALSHSQYGYRQGMHEVLAPLVYVLHLDVTHLSQVRQRYTDPFEDRFDVAYEENISLSKEARQAVLSFCTRPSLGVSDENALSGGKEWIHQVHPDDLILLEPDDFGFNLKTMLLGSDSYGAEGELGALLSGRFMEHDAYCMFDALLRGHNGAVALADYFLPANEGKSGISPVLEASTTMYHTLAAVDAPLYIHLVELGVEPQFFALRWFRVLFGREFDLEMLLHLWDAVLASSYLNSVNGDRKADLGNVETICVSFISIFAVSMILYLRSALLAAPNATVCLQKLLNFPKHVDVRNLIENAKVLQMALEESSKKVPSSVGKHFRFFEQSRGSNRKNHSPSPSFQVHIPTPSKVLQHRHSGPPEISRHARTESYWEEKWMSSILTKDEQEDVCGGDAGATGSDSASGNEPGINSSGHDVSDTSADNKQSILSNEAPPIQNNKPTRRNLFTAFWKGAAQLMSFEDRKADAATSTSDNKTGAVVEPSNMECQNKTEGEGATLSSAEANSSRALTSADGTLEVGGSESWASDDGETTCSGEEEGILHCTLDQGAIDVVDKKIFTHPLETVECLRSASDAECHQELRQDSLTREGISSSSESREVKEAFDTTQELKNDGKVKEKHSKAVLQTLGQSMVESIQVIESALSGLTKDGAPTAYRETAENLSKVLLNGKGHITALSALTELRKISSLLLQM